jgi:hypothetical protein
VYEYRQVTDDYKLSVDYHGKELTYILKLYNAKLGSNYYRLIAANKTLYIRFDWKEKKLYEVKLYPGPDIPQDFLDAIHGDVLAISSWT